MIKRLFCCAIVLYFCLFGIAAYSHSVNHHSSGHSNHGEHYNRKHQDSGHHLPHSHNRHDMNTSSHSEPVYLVKQDFSIYQQKFANCEKHYMTVETITNHYSDGSVRTSTNYTLLNSENVILISGCSSIQHIIFEDKHYFIISKNGFYLMDSEGNKISKHVYSGIEQFKPNRLIVKLNKNYGIIDLNENVIVPIKYQKFNIDGNGVFITKLNGYWGILDSENNVLVKNDCDKIKSLNDTLLIKRNRKYGLADLNGIIMYDIKYDKIKKLREYILVKDGNKFFVLDSDGERINDFSYKKIKLERNVLYGYTEDSKWVVINKN